MTSIMVPSIADKFSDLEQGKRLKWRV